MQESTVPPPVPRQSLQIFQTVIDGLMLPLRRPVLFAPYFLLTLVAAVSIVSVMAAIVLHPSTAAAYVSQNVVSILTAVVVIILASAIANEATIELTARAELGREMDLGEALRHVLQRFPVTLLACLAMGVGITVGLILLIIPGLIVMTRWMLVPTAVLLGKRGVREAFGISWRMTGEHYWPLTGLLLVVFVGIAVVTAVLGFIPVIGGLVASWLSFAWAAIALTLAYLRLGGPVEF
jgi:hypothetical protein